MGASLRVRVQNILDTMGPGRRSLEAVRIAGLIKWETHEYRDEIRRQVIAKGISPSTLKQFDKYLRSSH